MKNQTKKMVLLALLCAAGILMQLLESFVPVVVLVPGFKIGLANICGLYALYAFGPSEMLTVTLLRVVLASLATGTLFSIPFILSMSGSLAACLAMAVCRKAGIFSIYGVSIAGAAAHTITQVLVITILYQQYFMQLFLPVLLALSIVSGLLIAMLAALMLKRLPAWNGKTI